MAKKKRAKRTKATKKRVVAKGSTCTPGRGLWWGAAIVILKVLAIGFLIQGFVLQLATGVLYYGMLHYAIGVIFLMLAHCTKSKCHPC